MNGAVEVVERFPVDEDIHTIVKYLPCAQCDYTSNFESALKMHQQLHHDQTGSSNDKSRSSKQLKNTKEPKEKEEQIFPIKQKRSLRSLARSSSATRLLDKIRVRLCRSKLFSHPEETEEQNVDIEDTQYKFPTKIKEIKLDSVLKEISTKEKPNEFFGCHLCSLEADRITVLDRHLLNDHKIGMENLLKLVMDKTRDGLTEDTKQEYDARKSYYKPSSEIVMDTGFNNIKIFKHAASNTDLIWSEIPDLVSRSSSKEVEEIFDLSNERENKEVFEKMRTLNEYMSRFLSSSKALNRALSKELSHKDLSRPNERSHLGLGDQELRARCFSDGGDRHRLEDNRFFL